MKVSGSWNLRTKTSGRALATPEPMSPLTSKGCSLREWQCLALFQPANQFQSLEVKVIFLFFLLWAQTSWSKRPQRKPTEVCLSPEEIQKRIWVHVVIWKVIPGNARREVGKWGGEGKESSKGWFIKPDTIVDHRRSILLGWQGQGGMY